MTRIVFLIALLAAGFMAGWQVRAWKCDAAIKKAQAVTIENVEKAHAIRRPIPDGDAFKLLKVKWSRD